MSGLAHVLTTFVALLLITGCAFTPTPAPTPEPTSTTPPPEAPTPTTPPTATPKPKPVVEVTDDMGNKLVLYEYPKRIISTAPSVTESLFAIGAGDLIVGRDTHSQYPPEAQDIPDLGSFWQRTPVEQMLALNPDLVIAAGIINAEQVKQMQDAGLKVFKFETPKNLEELFEHFILLGKLTGREQQAKKLVAQLKERLEAVKAATASLEDPEKPLVYYELDGSTPDQPWTAGPNTFIDEAIEIAGGQNLGSLVSDQPWFQISAEKVIEMNPDIILIAHPGKPEEIAARPGWDAIHAVKEGRVYNFPAELMNVPGPRLIDGVETMAVVLHPDLFCAKELVNPDPQLTNRVCKASQGQR